MTFIDIELPRELAWGATGGGEWSTDVFQTIGGSEGRNQNRSHYLGRWDVGLVNKDATYTRALINFFNAVAKGRANTWRFVNLPNNDYNGYNEPIGTGDGADTTFQLIRRYTSGGQNYDKTIYLPTSGTVTCALNGTPTTAFTVNTTTGVLTFSVAPSLGVAITASFEFALHCRFDTDHFSCTRIDPDIFSWPSIPILEVLEAPA
jgi:uncharacterized protein (TIGR02217 family)